jgi:uncharacterized protein
MRADMPPLSAAIPLIIDVFELARLGDEAAGALPVANLRRLLPSLASNEGELHFRYRGYLDNQGRPAGTLEFETTVQLVCDRCTNPVALPLISKAQYYFVATEAELARIPVDESDEEPLLGSTRFDLVTLIEDDAILALPMSPRHAACDFAPAVDADGVEGADGAARERPHPFAALAKLKPRRN